MTNISALTSDWKSTATDSTPKAKNDLVSKDTFLQLLVAQIKNQDPLKPADGTQFLTQLAQFSELEQLVGIRGELTAAKTNTAATESTK
jgi:flagellar basal-body rod modification protein FlgD